MLGAFFRALGAPLSALLGAVEDEEGDQRIQAFTMHLVPLDAFSKAWAARKWNKAEDGSFFVRACFHVHEMSSPRVAVNAASHFYNDKVVKGHRLRFEIDEPVSEETLTLMDDAVDCFPPTLLVTRGEVRVLHDGEVQMDDDFQYGVMV